jgi:transcriptional regulator with XRE-family HTH domain
MQISSAIRALRVKAGLTQKQIGEAIGRTQATVSHLENHPAKNPRVSAEVAAGIKRLTRKHAKKLAS